MENISLYSGISTQLSENIYQAKNNYCFIKTDEDGNPDTDQGRCEFTGLWTNKRVELCFDDESLNLLVDFNLACALVNCDDFENTLTQAIGA